MPISVPAAIESPVPQPVRVSLYDSSTRYPVGTRWHGGVSYRQTPTLAADVDLATYDPCGPFEGSLDSGDLLTWHPWGIVLGSECLSQSTTEPEERAYAEARLDSQSDYYLERGFWTGSVAGSSFQALGHANRPLASPLSDDLTSTGAVGVVTAFSRAVQYLADTIGSLRGMIHVAPALAPFLKFYGVVRREGFQVLTELADHAVVIGSGYPGTGPDGSPPAAGYTWIYVTSMVRSEMAPVRSNTGLKRDGETQVNNVQAYASRLVIAEWDLTAHGAIEVCMPDPGPSCVEVPS